MPYTPVFKLVTPDKVLGERLINKSVHAGRKLMDGSITGRLFPPTFRVTFDVVPEADSTYDLGLSNLQWKDLHVDLVLADDVQVSAGAVGTPSITSENDSDTGMYWNGANVLGFVAEGTLQLRLTKANVFIETLPTTSDPANLNYNSSTKVLARVV